MRFHAWQSIFLNIAAIVLMVALSFLTVFGRMFGMFFFYHPDAADLAGVVCRLAVCVLKAVNGQRFKLPVIGDLAEKQAGS